MTDPKGEIVIGNLVAIEVNDFNQALRLYRLGCRLRTTASTNSNLTSSRSHCMIRVAITCFGAAERRRETNKLWLIDLGGSERVLKTKASGKRLDEGKAINLSLSALGDVISSLQRKRHHIPYRNSKLTQVLKDSLGDDSKTIMLVHVSPKEEDLCETICSLNFAARVKSVHLGTFLKLHQKSGVFLPVEGREVLRLQRLETLECNFSDLENFETFHLGGFLPLIACKVTVGRPSFSSLEDLNYTKSKSDLVTEAWFYDLMIDNATFLFKISFTKVVIVNCQNMRILCPLHRIIEILHLDGLMILETLFEAPSDRWTFPPFLSLKEIVIHKCHRMKVLLPPLVLSRQRMEVIVVEDCHNMRMIMGTDEEDRAHQMTFPLRRMGLKVLVLKKLPSLNSIYSGRLECNSLEEITVYDCPQLTRIPLTIPHFLKKIQVDPASLRNSFERGHESIFENL